MKTEIKKILYRFLQDGITSDDAAQQILDLFDVSCRFYRGYTIRNHGYYPPDKCVWWEAVNDETGEVDFHAKRLRDIISMINEALGVQKGT